MWVSFASPALKRHYQAVAQVRTAADFDSVFDQSEPVSRNKVSLYKGPAMPLPADELLAAETVRRLGCDGALVGIVEDQHGTPLNVGRCTRAIPPALKRALESRDHGCRFPGCTVTRFVEGHHVTHQNRDSGLQIDAATGASRWGGETMDSDVAIHALFEADEGLEISRGRI